MCSFLKFVFKYDASGANRGTFLSDDNERNETEYWSSDLHTKYVYSACKASGLRRGTFLSDDSFLWVLEIECQLVLSLNLKKGYVEKILFRPTTICY